MHILLKCQIFSSGQCHTRCRDTLYSRVISQVEEHYGAVDSTAPPEVSHEELGFLVSDTYGCKYYSELAVRPANLSLSGNLCCKVSVWQSRSGEEWKLLSSYQRVKSVDCGYTSLNELRWVLSGSRIHSESVDIHVSIRDNLSTAIDRSAHSVKYSSEHIERYTELVAVTKEPDLTLFEIHSCGILE